ncbi:hypothetical protein [Nonomuraea rubra]|uniref:Uncharacterized protein n=1 Tax=Nonomuraea rubra TaxID=46180 RepID=A0A7X0U5M6_9ACTN|nr:hypothetical protein [Nonomuraea rubra]MBB6556187.1 hypothetical protein [Nonomuraea rubra]
MTRWHINPETLNLDPEEDRGTTTFTDQEWNAQEWPACPVCGTTIDVSRISTPDLGDRTPKYIIGRWKCLYRCDIRGALQ